jgi:hypothetical protein
MTYADPQVSGQTSSPFSGQTTGQVSQSPSEGFVAGGVGGTQATQLSDYKIIRRNGSVVAFEPSKIAIAVTASVYFVLHFVVFNVQANGVAHHAVHTGIHAKEQTVALFGYVVYESVEIAEGVAIGIEVV